jgi:hypothetical protein
VTEQRADENGPVLLAAIGLAAGFLAAYRDAPVSDDASVDLLDEQRQAWDFCETQPLDEMAADLFELLGSHPVRSDPARYFRLFNRPALPAGIVGDLIAATVNAQLACRWVRACFWRTTGRRWKRRARCAPATCRHDVEAFWACLIPRAGGHR